MERYEFVLHMVEIGDNPAFSLACTFDDDIGVGPDTFGAVLAEVVGTLNAGLRLQAVRDGDDPEDYGVVETTAVRVAAPAPAPTPAGPVAATLAAAVAAAAATATPEQLCAALAALGYPVAPPAPATPAPAPADPLAAARALCR